jgi:hypothetical protein
MELELSVLIEGAAGGKIFVAAKGTKAKTNKLNLTYGPPTAAPVRTGIAPPMGLAAALKTLQESIKAASLEPPKLDFKSGEISLEFVVTKEGGLEFSIGDVGVSTTLSRAETQAVKLKFELNP